MAEKKEYTEKDLVIKEIFNCDHDVVEEDKSWNYYGGYSDGCIKEVLSRIPSADVVEVVRCKDCWFWDKEDSSGKEQYGNYVCACRYWSDIEVALTSYTRSDDFCSYGEKAEVEG